MDQFQNSINQFNSLPKNNLSNYYSPNCAEQTIMDDPWSQDVPDNWSQAFNIQQNSNSTRNALFRFEASGLNSLDTSGETSSLLSNSFTSNCTATSQQQQASSLNNNWKTINNLSTASNCIGPYKRKGTFEDDLTPFEPPTKQNATEEKVIGKLNMLSIDEEFDDEFIIALDDKVAEEIEQDLNNLTNDSTIEFETIDDDNVKFELSEDVQDFWNCDDVITKLVKDQREKDSKALVVWQPRNTISLSESKKQEIVERTDEYTVYAESEDEDLKDSNDKLEIIELEPFDTFNEEMEII